MSDRSEWLTAEQLAAELGQSPRWVKDKFASGAIPTIKIGSRRWFTPACRALLEASQLNATEGDSWSRPTRGRAS